jgi:hypothetical protein
LVWRPLRKRSHGKLKRMKDKIKMVLIELGCINQRWVKLSQDRVQGRALAFAVLTFQVISASILLCVSL